jgi:hypothetical protein
MLKYAELKRQGLFLRSSPDFYKTEWVGNSTSKAVSVSDPEVLVVHLRNPDTNASFYVARHADSTSKSVGVAKTAATLSELRAGISRTSEST